MEKNIKFKDLVVGDEFILNHMKFKKTFVSEKSMSFRDEFFTILNVNVECLEDNVFGYMVWVGDDRQVKKV